VGKYLARLATIKKNEENNYIKLRNQKDFFKKFEIYEHDVNNFESKYVNHTLFNGEYESSDSVVVIKNYTFINKKLRNLKFGFLEFNNCKFLNCEISNLTCMGTSFVNCVFSNSKLSKFELFECEIVNCQIDQCMCSYLVFSDTALIVLSFTNCAEILELYIAGSFCDNVQFEKSHISHTRFEPVVTGTMGKIYTFLECDIYNCYFRSNDLINSRFDKCNFKTSIFVNSILATETISYNNKTENSSYSSIDLHTINKSELINENVLKNIFGITEPDIKNFSYGLTNNVLLQTVFISYSFIDRRFAHLLNDSLKTKGVITFLWEKDAPGGRPLRKIMKDNVKKFERVLFISSVNSIKSKACQFELTQGRIKQDYNWTDVLFPIHIDNFLFEVEEEDIKPKEIQQEYWKNITELKDINSLDFTQFNTNSFDKIEFEKMVRRLIKDLKRIN
jgi:uncharacterized protein YjbI with pentapeptide repeats